MGKPLVGSGQGKEEGMYREAIASNHYSHDQQVASAVSYIKTSLPTQYAEHMYTEFPDIDRVLDSIHDGTGSWHDSDETGLDPEYTSWVTDWIEQSTPIYWEDGEPFIDLPGPTVYYVTIKIDPWADGSMTDDDTPDKWEWDAIVEGAMGDGDGHQYNVEFVSMEVKGS